MATYEKSFHPDPRGRLRDFSSTTPSNLTEGECKVWLRIVSFLFGFVSSLLQLSPFSLVCHQLVAVLFFMGIMASKVACLVNWTKQGEPTWGKTKNVQNAVALASKQFGFKPDNLTQADLVFFLQNTRCEDPAYPNAYAQLLSLEMNEDEALTGTVFQTNEIASQNNELLQDLAPTLTNIQEGTDQILTRFNQSKEVDNANYTLLLHAVKELGLSIKTKASSYLRFGFK